MLLTASFLSGAAGLVFELLWSKRLGLLLGSAATAQAAVLAAFLGGLALGSRVLGARADAAPSPLRFYAKLESAVALWGLLAPALLRLADGPARAAAPLGVLLHAFLMGGAIPALCRAAGGDAQRGLGRLYAANAAGASLGALAAAFALIPALGLGLAGFACGAALNLLAGAAALAAESRAAAAPPAPEPPPRPAALPAGWVLGAALVSGAAALVYETAWTRLLALTLGSSTYSFAEMLAALIAGLAVGGALAASPSWRRRDPAVLLGLACLLCGAAVVAALPLAPRLNYAFALLRGRFSGAPFLGFEAVKFSLCALVLLVPAACLGAVPALCARLIAAGGAGRAERVGELLAANALGNALGAAAGLWLLPLAGLAGALRAGACAHILCGAALLLAARPGRRGAVALAAGAALAAAALLPGWDARYFSRGIYRGTPVAGAGWKQFQDYHEGVEVLFHRDDREATVSALRYAGGQVSLQVNGKADASTGTDMATQVLMGSLPLLLKPGARSALIVGWGSGVSVGSALRHPLERLDAVELIPAVLPASRVFDAVNGTPLADPRLSVVLEDAKSFLAKPGPLYDVIASEPSNPWMAGVADLFSVEFYARARARLAPGGLFAQWFHLYEMDDEGFALVLRTFRTVFPHATLWRGSSGDAFIIGSAEPLPFDAAAFERAYLRPEVWRDLARVDIGTPATLLWLQSAGEESTAALSGEGPVNSELKPLLEHRAPRAFYRREKVASLFLADDRGDRRRREGLLLAAFLRGRGKPLQPRELKDWASLPHGRTDAAAEELMLEDWRRLYPRDPAVATARRLMGR